MYIHTFFAYPLVSDEFLLHESTVVVIDVLRASTTICHALHNGAREIIPVGDIEQAVRLSRTMSRETTLLGGERKGVRPTGFDLGNSPREYTADVVRQKSVILTTTNGIQALSKTKYAHRQLVGSFANLTALTEYILSSGNDVGKSGNIFLLCAGTNGDFSYEDMAGAGAIADRLYRAGITDVSDATRTAMTMFTQAKDSPAEHIRASQHAHYLMSLGFDQDIDDAASIDSCPVTPVLEGPSFKAA
jgi:2-phosphosulfolactate phosphatase